MSSPRLLFTIGSILALGAAFAAEAQSGRRPAVGFNIVVNRKAGGGMAFVAASTASDGRFSASVHLQQPGDYEIFSACRAGALCTDHELVSLTVNGQPVPRGENPTLQTRGRGVYTVSAPASGAAVVIAGEVQMVAVAAPGGSVARQRAPNRGGPTPPRAEIPD